jgi:hypothetical protein
MNSEPLSESMPRIGEGELGDDVFDGLEDPDSGLVLDRAVYGPTGENVSNGEGKAELAAQLPPS